MDEKLPYPECKLCVVLDDCPHPDIEDNEFGTPMPPEACPRPIDVMNKTFKKHKLNKSKYHGHSSTLQ